MLGLRVIASPCYQTTAWSHSRAH